MIQDLQAVSLLAETHACVARIAAMEAANFNRRQDSKADAYGESAFFYEAETLDSIANRAIQVIHSM